MFTQVSKSSLVLQSFTGKSCGDYTYIYIYRDQVNRFERQKIPPSPVKGGARTFHGTISAYVLPRRITATLSKENGARRISGFIVNLLRVHGR